MNADNNVMMMENRQSLSDDDYIGNTRQRRYSGQSHISLTIVA